MASYDARSGGEPVVRGVSLPISAGTKVTGSGRSGRKMILRLGCTLRLLGSDASSNIMIDGVNTTTLPQ